MLLLHMFIRQLLMANPATDPYLTYDQIKYIQKFVLTDTLASILSPCKPRDDVFYWYNGHDPYNSADNHAFMERIARRAGVTDG